MLRLIALAGLAMATTMTVGGAPAAPAQEATFYTVTYIEAGPVLAKVGAAALKAYREATRKENGVVFFEVLQRIDRPNQFAVLGAWANQAPYDAHAAGANAKQFDQKPSGPMTVAPQHT